LTLDKIWAKFNFNTLKKYLKPVLDIWTKIKIDDLKKYIKYIDLLLDILDALLTKVEGWLDEYVKPKWESRQLTRSVLWLRDSTSSAKGT